jgi:hypothetical protein
MTTLHGIEIKKGDKVWGLREGWFEVNYLSETSVYPIQTPIGTYTVDGKLNSCDKFPTIFWNEFQLPEDAFTKPLPKMEVDAKVLVWNYSGTVKEKHYFSHFDDKGRIHCFIHGLTSWNNVNNLTSWWEHWELFEEHNDD